MPAGAPSGQSRLAGGSLLQQMASPASAALSTARMAAGASGQLPKPGDFCSQRPRHRFARCHAGICRKQDSRLISSISWGWRSRLPWGWAEAVHGDGCCVQPPFAPTELDLSTLSFCPCLLGTCWPSVQAAKVLVAEVQQQRGKWRGAVHWPQDSIVEPSPDWVRACAGTQAQGAFPGCLLQGQTVKLNWGVNGMFVKHGTKHYWPETCTVQAKALHPRQLNASSPDRWGPTALSCQHLHHPCPVCSSLPPNSLTS